ncbi:hypothetical protein TPHA_0I02900 [Tetrapisispora phaffii CBS 4417]|uniref:Small ribosomal subunit protein uS7m n=1 Tax=Tetrapisispora phaffii (strain ATCC 24235 / CBS 4417 / NBRC 1672 / NRRL Y-8282 / UCD 70-5) TaxID=1071381 RepID=G8BY13_TETPH|nr:mitochondrial 37S ribosomal protein RSM7 TPHA_0I02900 [Tetrapisispora phaffii CBS 4417]CCE64791.1 hypothetical protein TPHA_0I02900 [Tetrapisispora phaffii CBS 4417]
MLRLKVSSAPLKCLNGRLLNVSKIGTQICLSKRFESGKVEAKVKPPINMSDEDVDGWLKTLSTLKEEFSQTEYLPEHSLSPPGQSKIDIAQEAANMNKDFIPTEEQLLELDLVKSQPFMKMKDPVLTHITNMIMKDGKKQRAERTISKALYIVFCKTREDPVEILKKCLDDLAPLMLVKTFNTGVAKSAVIPVPLNKRQRDRLAWKWIIEGANKRASNDFSVRLGEEILSVHDGNSSGFEKRDQLHKTAIVHRSYIKLK